MTGDFSGARVLITAAGAGIGRRVAERFLDLGARVFAADIDGRALASLPAQMARQLCDVAEPSAVAALFDAALAELGGLDILVNGAGTAGPTATIEDSDPEQWRRCIDVNLTGTYLCLRRALAAMKGEGSGVIVNFSSTAGLFAYPLRSAYCAAKWAVIGLTKAAAVEAGPSGVRVNAVCPGVVSGARMDRVMAEEAAASGLSEAAVREAYTQGNSLKSWIDADDIAACVLFLCSPAAAKISGQAIPVDGFTQGL